MDRQLSATIRGKDAFEGCRACSSAPRRSNRLQEIARSGSPRHAALPGQSCRPGGGGSRAQRYRRDEPIRVRSPAITAMVGHGTGKVRRENLPERRKFSSGQFRAKRAALVSQVGKARNSASRPQQRHRPRICAHHHWYSIRDAPVVERDSKAMEGAGMIARAKEKLLMSRTATIHRKTNETDIHL